MTTDTTTVTDRWRDLLVEHLGVERAAVQPDKHLVDDLGADSLDTVELVMMAEEEFAIEITDEEAENLNTVQDWNAFLEGKVSAR